MKKNKWYIKHIFIFCFMNTLYAQDNGLIERAWDFGIGIGYGEQSNPFIGADNVPTYLTFNVAIYGKRLFFDNGDFGFTLVDRESYGLNLIATYSSERIYYSFFNTLGLVSPDVGGVSPRPPDLPVDVVPIDIPIDPGLILFDLDLPDRDFAVNFGFELLWNKPFGNIQIQALTDVSNKHNGQEISIDYSKPWGRGRWLFQPNLGVSWKSSGLVDYYYGLDPSSSELNFSYQGENVTNFSAGLLSSYRINSRVSLVASIKYTRFGSSISSSPLVAENFTRSIFTGIFYRF